MDDDRLRSRMRRANEASAAPLPAFVDGLHDDLAARLGLGEAGAIVPHRDRVRLGGRLWLLPAAVLSLLGVAAALGGAGSLIDRFRSQPTMLESIAASGTLRVAVRADHPQSQPALSALDGFDVAVAESLADRLGVRLDLVVAPGDALPLPASGDTVLAMPSRAIPAPVASTLITTEPYYRWPVYLVVPAADGASATLEGLGGQRICAVAGSAGEAWLTSTATEAGVEAIKSPPIDAIPLPAADDQACLDALEHGTVDAAVTTRLLPGDLLVAGDLVVGGEPVAREPAVIVVGDGRGAGELQRRLDGILEDLRRDGSLRALSLRWLGGEDLTSH